MVELAAVPRNLGPGIEEFAKHLLNGSDFLANANSTTESFLHVFRSGEMIRVDMGLEDPLHFCVKLLYSGDQLIRAGALGSARFGVIAEHAIDNRLAAALIVSQVVV